MEPFIALFIIILVVVFLIYGIISVIKHNNDVTGKTYINTSEEYARHHQLIFSLDKTDFLENLPYENLHAEKFKNVIEGNQDDLEYWYGLFETIPDENNNIVNKSFWIIKNKHLGLPHFCIKRSGAYFNKDKIKIENEKRFVVVGRPEILVKQIFIPQLNEAISRIFQSYSGIGEIEAAGEYIFIQGAPSFRFEDYDKIKLLALTLSKIIAQNEEFNVDPID